MNKAFSAFAKFYLHCLVTQCSKLSKGSEGVAHYTYLKNHCESIELSARDPSVWKVSKALQKEYEAEKRKHLRTIYPGLQQLVADSVEEWNSSSENKTLRDEAVGIYNSARNSRTGLSNTDYNKFAQYLLLLLSTVNRNRKTVISELTNRMVWAAEEVYRSPDKEIHVGKTQKDGWENIGRVVTMQRSSGATKTEETVSVYINPFCWSLCRMYGDIKKWFFDGQRAAKMKGKGDNEPDARFFLSATGGPAVVSKTTFAQFAKVGGLPGATTNTLRKGATTKFRENPEMRPMESVIMDHSEGVAVHHYDQGRTSQQVRGKDWLSEKSQGTGSTVDLELSPDTVAKWKEAEEEESRKARELSLKFMVRAETYSNPARKVTRQWRILPEWRKRLVTIMVKDGSEIARRVLPPKVFPKDRRGNDLAWTKTFYRWIDSLNGQDGEEIREIERNLFHKVRRKQPFTCLDCVKEQSYFSVCQAGYGEGRPVDKARGHWQGVKGAAERG